jgi:hypothetical protein
MLSLALLAGCKLATDTSKEHVVGVFTVNTHVVNDTEFTTAPTGVFFVQVNTTLPDSRTVGDSCQYQSIPTDTAVLGGLQHVDAGSAVTVQTDRATGTLVPDTSARTGFISYNLVGNPLPFTPGTTVSFLVNGSNHGFPPSSIAGQTVESYAFGPIDPAPSDSLIITWSPALGAGWALVLELKFASDANQQMPDKELYCALADDGIAVVPASLAVRWRNAPLGRRTLDSYKWHTTTSAWSNSELLVISQFNLSKATFP